jgi:hypothetical protein
MVYKNRPKTAGEENRKKIISNSTVNLKFYRHLTVVIIKKSENQTVN